MTHDMLTQQQLRELEITERVASCFSLAGTSFIFCTFIYSPAFRKPVNRLIFYASWGNMLCNIATLISQSGIRAGRDSPLCQFQGFLIQMFLPADAFWNLAMAINVYLTLFRNYNAQQLKLMEWKYHVMCYGFPFVVALVYIFIHPSTRGFVYGPAVLWCWISIEWVALRIALCYAPAWVAITLSFCIYLMAGHEVFAKRKQLRAFNQHPSQAPSVENPFTNFKTTEVQITRELIGMHAPQMPEGSHGSHGSHRRSNPNGFDQYTVSIGSTPLSPRIIEPSPTVWKNASHYRSNRATMEANAAAWGYTKVALLFFVSLLVTWVPSSVNRFYSLIHPDRVSIPFTYASGVVLPLMGFWNSVIYIAASRKAVAMLFTGKLQPGTSKTPCISPPLSNGALHKKSDTNSNQSNLTVGQGHQYLGNEYWKV